MKLRKVNINGKTYYEEVDEDNIIDPEIVEPNDKKAKDYENNNGKEKSKFNKDFNQFLNSMKNLGKNISHSVNNAVNNAVKSTKNVFQENSNTKDVTSRLAKVLPYMDEDDIHEVALRILKDDPEFEGLDLEVVMPFMDDEDIDAIFMKMINDGKEINLKLVHFVDSKCLSKLVDLYVQGKYQDLDVDALYPYLDKNDIKRIFYYELNKKK